MMIRDGCDMGNPNMTQSSNTVFWRDVTNRSTEERGQKLGAKRSRDYSQTLGHNDIEEGGRAGMSGYRLSPACCLVAQANESQPTRLISYELFFSI